MITRRDIITIGESKTNLKKLSSEIKRVTKGCSQVSTILFDSYLFRMYINKEYAVQCYTLNQLNSTSIFDKKICPIKLNHFLQEHIQSYKTKYDELKILWKQYWKLRQTYGKALQRVITRTTRMINEITDKRERKRMFEIRDSQFRQIKFSEGTRMPSSGEVKVMRVLDIISEQYEFYYFYLHRWNFCRDAYSLEYDFYCILMYNGYFYHWVIEFDGDQHYSDCGFFTSDHARDILKQYYLAELNIHLLRIRESSFDIVFKKIQKFINVVINTNVYVATDYIVPIEERLMCNGICPGLKYFNKTILDKSCGWLSRKSIRDPRRNDRIIINKHTKGSPNNYIIHIDEDDGSDEDWVFVTDDLKMQYGFIEDDEEEVEEEIDEQEILDFVYGRIKKMKPSKVIVEDDNSIDEWEYEDNKRIVELFMLIDGYNAKLIEKSSNDDVSDDESFVEEIDGVISI